MRARTRKGSCAVIGCNKPVAATGMCLAHYRRKLRYGDPLLGGTMRGKPMAWLLSHVTYDGNECLIWPFARSADGYTRIRKNGRAVTASRLMCELVNGTPPEGRFEAAHSCGNGAGGCVHPKHLRWATCVENNADKKLHGTHLTGEAVPTAKFTDQQVSEMRESRRRGEKLRVIATRFGTSQRTVQRIVTYQSRVSA